MNRAAWTKLTISMSEQRKVGKKQSNTAGKEFGKMEDAGELHSRVSENTQLNNMDSLFMAHRYKVKAS